MQTKEEYSKIENMMLTILKLLPLVVLGLTILFGGHYFLYYSFIRFFGIDNSQVKLFLFIILFLLSLSFILSSALAHFRYGLLAKSFYIFSASWIGMALSLLLAAGLIWLINWFAVLAGFKPNILVLGAVVFSLAIIFSGCGFWNAFHPQVKNMEVAIKNLPSEWKDKTIVQLSDVHLGNINGLGFLQNIVEKVNALHPDLIFITGDLFDGMDGDLDIFKESLNKLQARSGIFFVTGNHETYLGIEKVFSALEGTNIKILNDEFIELDGLQIVGISYPIQNQASDITGQSKNTASVIASLKNFDRTKATILLHHSPTNLDQAKASGVNLQLSGHTHQGQLFPVNILAR